MTALSRQQRRRLERALPKLFERNVCSFCGNSFPHNSPTAGGFDAHGNVVLAGECCVHRVAQIFSLGLALNGAHQATADRIFDDANGVLHSHPWTSDDRQWFERNPQRSHRARPPFPGECDEEVAKTPASHALIMLLRQVEPGRRLRVAVPLGADLVPLLDDEAGVHGLFELAMGNEPMPPDRQALHVLIAKYAVRGRT
jgi:hypothetical protein